MASSVPYASQVPARRAGIRHPALDGELRHLRRGAALGL
jgi:hypothetical protein